MDDITDEFVTTSLMHTEEDFLRYRPGGFHPVHLNDSFKNGRYIIKHKLGWGGYSTVWLADDTANEEWVSIKIMSAECSANSPEVETLKAIQTASRMSERSPVVQLLDSFIHSGPNGHHQCLVFELLGPTLANLLDIVIDPKSQPGQSDPDVWGPRHVLKACRGVLSAIDFVHEAGFIHGDVSTRNFAFSAHLLYNLNDDEFWEAVGRPKAVQLIRKDGQPLGLSFPRELVQSAAWSSWMDDDVEELCLLDLAEATRHGAWNAELAQPSQLRAPETILSDSYDRSIDLWRAGIVLHLLIFGFMPFWYFGDASLIHQCIEFTGDKVPAEWQQRWSSLPGYEKACGDLARDRSPVSGLRQHFSNITDPKLKALLPIIEGLMRFRPTDRLTAREALNMLPFYESSQASEASSIVSACHPLHESKSSSSIIVHREIVIPPT